MKIKLYSLALLSMLFALPAASQEVGQMLEEEHYMAPAPKVNTELRALGDTSTVLLNYSRLMGDFANTTYYRTYLYPDNTPYQMYSNGPGKVSRHSLGQVLEPGENIWYEYLGHPLGPTMRYTVDTVYVPYRYVRYNDSIPDTLLVQFYNTSKISTGTVSTWESGASYATVNYDWEERKGAFASKEFVYELTQKDTATTTLGTPTGILAIPVDMGFNTGQFAATITYFPGKPANEGDTIEVYDSEMSRNKNKVNAFIVYQRQEQGWDFVIKENFNNGLQANTSQRYNETGTNWLGRYSPGTAYASASGTYHTDMFFFVRYVEAPYSTPEHVFEDVKMYPNPTSSLLNLDLGTQEGLVVSVLNLEGRELLRKTQNSGQMSFDLSSFPAGMYLLKMSNDKFTATEKLMKE